MMQIGRNLTDPIDGFLAEKKYLILDRDSKYSSAPGTGAWYLVRARNVCGTGSYGTETGGEVRNTPACP